MNQELPEIVKCAERLLAEVTLALRGFSRANRFEYGADLRRRAMDLASLGMRAWREAPRRVQLLEEFIRQLDDFKTWLRLGKQVRIFASFAQFEQLARTAEELGRQAWGWKQGHLNSQSSPAQQHAPTERAEILSSRAARPIQLGLIDDGA